MPELNIIRLADGKYYVADSSGAAISPPFDSESEAQTWLSANQGA